MRTGHPRRLRRATARRTLVEPRSAALERADLAAALRELAREADGTAVKVEVVTQGTARRLDSVVEHNLFRIAQEALTNALRHSGARLVTLAISFQERELQLVIRDDGAGMDPDHESHGFGLAGMRERARKIGARIEIRTPPEGGSEISVNCPG